MNLQNTYNYANAIDFINTNTNFTNANWANFAQDQVALDAHWAAENILDYWRNVQNRNSLDNLGIRILGYAHAGITWNNAQWIGGTNNHYMQYGDGDGVTFRPLTALDICAHEMGHGITEFTSALTPGTQESGALNEGFSDIYGACVEHWAAPNKQTWLMGEEIFVNPAFTCIRNLQNPKSTTAAEGQHPDTYHGQFWDNNGEPHNNSTVLSHWFFLLSQGGNGTNDIGNVFIVNGIGINEAQLIAFRGESIYLTAAATYQDARTATIQAARDLYGVGSCEEIAATNAWFAVGVGGQYANNNLSISGSSPVCTSAQFSISNLPAGSNVTWSSSNNYIATVSSTGIVNQVTNGNAIIYANVTTCGSTNAINISKPIKVGTYTQSDYQIIASPSTIHSGVQNQFGLGAWMINDASATYNWSWRSFNYISGQGTRVVTLLPVGTTGGYVGLSIGNACGWSNPNPMQYFPFTTTYALIVSPNPVSNNINVNITDVTDTLNTSSKAIAAEGATNNSKGITRMSLYDFNTNALVKQWTYNESSSLNYSLNIAGVKSGYYVLKMERDNKIAITKILVQ